MRIKLLQKLGGYGVVWGLIAVTLLWGGCNCAPNYERESREKLTGFFSEELPLKDFSMNSPWKKTFKPDNIKKRAPVDIQSVELLEVRLPGSPGGLEAAFRVTLKAAEPFQLKNVKFVEGRYIAAGTMKFIETTRGIVIQDVDFALVNQDGNMIGANYLPWKIQ